MSPRLRFGSVSVTGNVRENNEDRCWTDPHGRFFLVADGMGGQSAGEKASEMAVDMVSGQFNQLINFEHDNPDEVVRKIDQGVSFANAEIMALSELDPDYHNMGTTLALLVHAGGRLFAAGVGDSRVYLWRGDKLQRLTRDHSLSEALVEAGTITREEAARHRYRNHLYRYLGTKEGGTGTTPQLVEPQPGDRLLMCSDGVLDGVPEDKLAALVSQPSDPQQTAEGVVQAALQGGSRDNVTCVIVFVE